ncbi:MAG: hypothetical protein IT326_09085 [Anaerolineae bacterium]|nr:hypothetical protein [Anaerolineae bacterium]
MRRFLATFLIGLGLGTLAGVLAGWGFPIQDTRTGLDQLHPDYKAEYVVMVGTAYAASEDWDQAQAWLGELAEPDPAGYVVALAERFIAEGRNPDDIRSLVRLASRFGYVSQPMQPYLPPAGQP